MGYLKMGTINNLCNDQKEKKCQSTKKGKIVKNPNGRNKNREITKRERKTDRERK